MITNDSILKSPRFAGAIKRYHTWPTLQAQTNADHCYHVLRIYSMIFGLPSPEVTGYIIWHDAGEIKTGDLPHPIKANNPALKEVADRLEAEAVKDMGGPSLELSDDLKVKVKMADCIEMLEFSMVELGLGNSWAQPISQNMSNAIQALIEKLPELERRSVIFYLHKIAGA